MVISDIKTFHESLVVIGLVISGCDGEGNVHLLEPDTNNLVPLVLAAHEQPLDSEACQALKAAISDEQWLAYQECRKQPIRQQREQRYRTETDPLFMSAFENATRTEDGDTYILKVPKVSFDDWSTAKDKIRLDCPYPE